MKLLIGCPMYKRSWILPHWIRCIVNQSLPIEDIGFVFEVSPDDTETIQSLEAWKKYDNRIPYFNIKIRKDIPHFQHENNGRQWTLSKYQNMVSLRNSLLTTVRDVSPEYYFSLDSDILLTNPNTLELLIAHIKSGADAVNPLMFMTPFGTMYPSVMTWREGMARKAFRQEKYSLGTYFKSDVIMAAKMMNKKVYSNIDYSVHEQGEDVGWSWECKEAGYNLFCASYIYAPHIMSELMYGSFLKHGDERSALIFENYTKV
jgi:hypothetical protein